jgi:hypothetical protein
MNGTTTMTKLQAEIWTFGKPLSELTASELAVQITRAWDLSNIEKLTALRGERARRVPA